MTTLLTSPPTPAPFAVPHDRPATDADRVLKFLIGAAYMRPDGVTFDQIRDALPDRTTSSIAHTLAWLERDGRVRWEAEGDTPRTAARYALG